MRVKSETIRDYRHGYFWNELPGRVECRDTILDSYELQSDSIEVELDRFDTSDLIYTLDGVEVLEEITDKDIIASRPIGSRIGEYIILNKG